MKSLYHIASRLSRGGTDKSRPAVNVAVLAAMLGVTVMILTLAVVVGFKREIRHKVIGFDAHIQVVNYDNNNTYDMQPVRFDSTLLHSVAALQEVRHVSRFATKPGILKTGDDVEAIIFKGVGEDYDWDFFRHNLSSGQLPDSALSAPSASREVIISTTLARLMHLGVGDDFLCYFVGEKVRARKLHISGLYNTDFQDYDKLFIIGDLRQVQKLNNWQADQVSGLEILISDFDRLGEATRNVQHAVANRFDEDLNTYFVQNAVMTNPQIFSWLDLLNVNVVVIIVLMLIVTGFTLISALIILILDAIPHIGTLKALGATDRQIQHIFIYQAAAVLIKGLLVGNVVGILLCAVQYYWHLVPLDPASYYVNFVPVAFTWGYWLLLNIGIVAVTLLMLLAPAQIISRINPARVIRYD